MIDPHFIHDIFSLVDAQPLFLSGWIEIGSAVSILSYVIIQSKDQVFFLNILFIPNLLPFSIYMVDYLYVYSVADYPANVGSIN